MRRILIVIAAMSLMLLVLAAPAGANFSNGPSEAGNVERFDSPGFGVIPDFDDGLLLFANVNSIADACNDIPAGAGDEQVVGGGANSVLHDDDVPLIVAPLGPPDAICGNPDAWPVIATGTGDVRASNGGFRIIGTVEEPDGQLWNVQARENRNGPSVHLVKRG